MPKIELRSPVGQEAPQTKGLNPLTGVQGNRLAFLFNGHVSVMSFWRSLEEEINLRCEPASTVKVVKPNTFAPASAATVSDLSQADLALVGVCA